MVVGSGPVTSSAPVNLGIGLTAAGLINAGTNKLSQDDPLHNVIGIGLNVIMQPMKSALPFLKHYEWAILFMLLISFLICFFFLYPNPQDHPKVFRDSILGVFDALGNYKADKASGLNIFKPAEG